MKNLLENAPFERVVNGFRIKPIQFKDGYIWAICPNRCNFNFYFPRQSCAFVFAKSFTNDHTENFWFKKFSHVYGLVYVRSVFESKTWML